MFLVRVVPLRTPKMIVKSWMKFMVSSTHLCYELSFNHGVWEFYYYMQGNHVGTLNAYAVRDGFPPPISLPWNKTGGTGRLLE